MRCQECNSTDEVEEHNGKQLCYTCRFLEKYEGIKRLLIASKNGKIDS